MLSFVQNVPFVTDFTLHSILSCNGAAKIRIIDRATLKDC